MVVRNHEDMDLSSALLVTGFASFGIVGSIATNYLVRSLDLRRIASVLSDEFPPMAVVRGGQAYAPMRIHAAEMVCGPDGICHQLAVGVSDFVPKPEMMAEISEALLDWAERKGIRQIITMEGLAIQDEPTDGPVFAFANDERMRERLGKLDVQFLEDAVMSGFSGLLQYRGEIANLPVASLLVSTQEDFPDARGAAKLVSCVSPLVPNLKIDPDPLFKEAERLEDELKSSIQQQAEAASEISKQSRIMFG